MSDHELFCHCGHSEDDHYPDHRDDEEVLPCAVRDCDCRDFQEYTKADRDADRADYEYERMKDEG